MDRMLEGTMVAARCERCGAVVLEQGVCPACMLRAGLDADLFPPEPASHLAPAAAESKPRPRHPSLADAPIVNGYELREEIGRGGMGVVYLAEQTSPIRRRVAIKLIKLGMDTRQVIARFEAERQALAMMDHANVAKVLDAGASDTGRPYFVMELVRGPRITDYCDRFQLSTRERLELFLQVCRAIHHAHQKGVIHRDIKPSNILVTQQDGAAVLKVIDFGIAKATGGLTLTDKTLLTDFREFLGTPAYTSPEQAAGGGDIDTRTDIYSLGVLLYELLTGCTPFDSNELLRAGWDVMRRTIRETEPQRPSTRLTSLASDELGRVSKRRRIEPPKLIHVVRGDLDWIVMKCLEKERERRYDTCAAIGHDIERHLRNEPVTARPPSRAYRIRKLVRRHAPWFVLGSLMAATLLLGLGAATWSVIKQAEARAVLRYFKKSQVERTVLPATRSAAHPFRATAKGQPADPTEWLTSLQAEGASPTPGKSLTTHLASFSASRTTGISQRLAPATGTDIGSTDIPPPGSASPTLPTSGTNSDEEVAPAETSSSGGIGGESYSQLAAAWWTWLMQLPLTNSTGATHPLLDTPFFDVTEGQPAGLCFLATPFGSVRRSCIIPAGTWIFLGLLNAECSTLEALDEGFHGSTAIDQAACAKSWVDHIVNLFCEIDGVPVPDLPLYRVLNPQITFTAPTPWIFGAVGGTGTSVGDGYFMLISPFAPGQHTIRYGGAFQFRRPADPFDDLYPMEMIYLLTVQ